MITGLALALLAGCDSYTVELNPNWEEDSSEASIQDPTTADPSVVDPSSEDPSVEDTTTEDPVDTEPPVIDLSLDDEPADPDEMDPDDPTFEGNCEDVICPEEGPYCYDALGIECCPACEAGLAICDSNMPMIDYHSQYVCAGGCWQSEPLCDGESYCKENPEASGDVGCAPLPLTFDDFCDPQFEYVDPDCQLCSYCEFPGESYCHRTGVSPDNLIQCVDQTGYGHHCWISEPCSTSGFDSYCVEDFAQNLAACTGFDTQESICSQFICTGVETCNADGTADENPECGFCNTCCDATYGPLCGNDSIQSEAAILVPNSEGSCFETELCEEDAIGTTTSYCRISNDGLSASCEPANFFGP